MGFLRIFQAWTNYVYYVKFLHEKLKKVTYPTHRGYFIDIISPQERMNQESESLYSMIIWLNLFKVRARVAKVIFVCCFRDPRGLLSRERVMFRRQTFGVWQPLQ